MPADKRAPLPRSRAPVLPPRSCAQVETDKATMEWEATDEGTVARILAPAGSEAVPVGQVVAVLVEEAEDAGAFANYEAPAAGASATKIANKGGYLR